MYVTVTQRFYLRSNRPIAPKAPGMPTPHSVHEVASIR